MADYTTVKAEASAVIYEKKSEFIGYISHAKTEQQAIDFLNKIRKKHHDATHNCYAYTIKDENIERQSDDGEPSKTAGMPILEVLRHSGIEDAIIVVTRYFGGTLLGTGGLVRAYTESAKAAIGAAQLLCYSLCVDVSINIDYSLYDRVCVTAQNNEAKIIETEFTDSVMVKMRILSGKETQLVQQLTTLTKGLIPNISGEIYDIF